MSITSSTTPRRGVKLEPLRLASASPRRADILRRAGIPFVAAPVAIDEDAIAARVSDPVRAAIAVAQAKANAARCQAGADALILAADTVVVLGRSIMGKPNDAREATAILGRLRGVEHRVATGVALSWRGRLVANAEVTVVRFRRYSDKEISEYVDSGSPFDKAGGYGIQDESFAPVSRLRGCRLNVVGLPMCLVANLLTAVNGVHILQQVCQPTCPDHDRT